MDPIASLGLAGATAPTPTASQGLGGLDGDAFMTLLVTQLRYQDPLAPTDTHGLLQQTSLLAQTEMLTQVSQMQQQLLGLQRATMATDLIGEQVQGIGATGETIEGTVDGVRFDITGPVLLIGGDEIALDNATGIGRTDQTDQTGTDLPGTAPDGSDPTDTSDVTIVVDTPPAGADPTG